jgi:predicted Zn-dependent protease
MDTEDSSSAEQSAWKRWVPGLLVAAAIVAGVVGACGTAADVVMPPAREEQLGDQVEAEFLDSGVELYERPTASQYIKQMGREAVDAAGEEAHEAIEYEFRVIDDPEQVNAFAMPGGQIYFYTGLLKLAETKAEVMSVMAHEVAHVTQRHIAKRLVAIYGIQSLTQAALGENPGLVAQLVSSIAAKGALLKYSRDTETEADSVGMQYMIEAGYDPHGFVNFFQKLKDQGGGVPIKWLSSHPLPSDRIEAAQEKIGDREFEDATVGREEHQQVLRSLQEGDNGGTADAGSPTGPDAAP